MASGHRKHDGVETHRHTLGYWAAETSQVMRWIKAGRPSCIVGLRGAGKASFLCFLLRYDAQQHHPGQAAADFALILIDLLAPPISAAWAVSDLILNLDQM